MLLLSNLPPALRLLPDAAGGTRIVLGTGDIGRLSPDGQVRAADARMTALIEDVLRLAHPPEPVPDPVTYLSNWVLLLTGRAG